MSWLFSLFLGSAVAIGATLIHQTLPPFGLILALISTATAIWWLGRLYGKRIYKFLALTAWIIVIARAGTFGVGQELLIQGDNVGSSLLLFGFIFGVFAAVRKP